MKQFLLFICFLLGVIVSSLGQEIEKEQPTIATDRPGASDASSTVLNNSLQIETGAGYSLFKEGSFKSENFTYQSTFIRYGLLENLELRLGWSYNEIKTQNTFNDTLSFFNESGFNPLTMGVKIAITDEKGWIPQMALIGQITAPFAASEAFKSTNTGANFRFSFSNTLSNKSSLTYNLGANWSGNNLEMAYLYTLNYGYSISDKLGVFAEIYGDFPENASANHLWDAGLTYLINNNLQLDTSFGTSITQGQDLFLGLGLSYRITK